MADGGSGILAIWMDCDPALEADFNAWYDREHLPERVGVPGFVRGLRYAALEADRAYFTWYLTRDSSVLASKAYRDRLDDPTSWTRRVMPAFRRTIRSAMTVAARTGSVIGAHAAVLRAPRDFAVPDLDRLAGAPGAVSAEHWRLDAGATGGPTAEVAMRGPDELAEEAVLVQTTTAEAAERAAAALAGSGAVGVYALRAGLAA